VRGEELRQKMRRLPKRKRRAGERAACLGGGEINNLTRKRLKANPYIGSGDKGSVFRIGSKVVFHQYAAAKGDGVVQLQSCFKAASQSQAQECFRAFKLIVFRILQVYNAGNIRAYPGENIDFAAVVNPEAGAEDRAEIHIHTLQVFGTVFHPHAYTGIYVVAKILMGKDEEIGGEAHGLGDAIATIVSGLAGRYGVHKPDAFEKILA
jgi:hypothetical protein